MKSSLCLIGKDEAEGLKDLIEDIGEYYDEIILVSTDHNKKLIKMGEKLGCKVFDEYFGKSGVDFDTAAARNSSFEHATGDILSWFDLDDRIPNGEVIKEIFEAMDKTDIVYCTYNYAFNKYGECIMSHLKPRFMKAGTGHWAKSVHEDYVLDKGCIQSKDADFLVDPLIINHQNFYKSKEDLEKINAKARRNLGLLIREYEQDGENTDLRTIQYIGMTLISLERYAEAVPFLLQHYRSTGAQEDKFWSIKRAAFCHKQLGEYDQALNLMLEGLKLFPHWQTMYFDIADVYSQMGKYPEVIEWTLTGMNKSKPDTVQIIEPLDYELNPLGRLADAYLMTMQPKKAMRIARALKQKYPRNDLVKELFMTCQDAEKMDDFVSKFLDITDHVRRQDRLKAIKLFECIPNRFDEDIRLQTMRQAIVPPKTWDDNSVVIYCGKSLEEWAYPSIFTGIGGSEESVIQMSRELTKLGYKVTVYNKCGDYRGEYDGVEYIPFYHFNPMDNFNTLIGWRNPRMFENEIKAKKKIVWLHDIATGWQFSEKAIENTDKFIFLSKWHRNNMPSIPEEKVFISNNGIDPDMFKDKLDKNPNSLCWSSSYDRGLLPFINNIWPLIKKEIPDVTLEVAYGWQNIDKELDILPELRTLREELTPLLENTEGITHHGRLSHKDVADMYKRSLVLAYASEFGETNNISSMKAQASACYVLTTQQAGGTPERLKFGEAIPFNDIYTDKEAQEYYAKKVVEYLKSPKTAPEGIVESFSWSKTAESWKEGLLCTK